MNKITYRKAYEWEIRPKYLLPDGTLDHQGIYHTDKLSEIDLYTDEEIVCHDIELKIWKLEFIDGEFHDVADDEYVSLEPDGTLTERGYYIPKRFYKEVAEWKDLEKYKKQITPYYDYL
jgi:hypothetical protein